MTEKSILTTDLHATISRAIARAGGWLGFDEFMSLALYAPGLGYYANDSRKFGLMPGGVKGGGSDFVTAPELSPQFGQTLARQVSQALQATGLMKYGNSAPALAHWRCSCWTPSARCASATRLSICRAVCKRDSVSC